MAEQRLLVPALGSVYRALAPFTELLVRVVAGLSLVAHGYPKFGALGANAEFFDKAGFSPGWLWVIAVALTESVGGLFLAMGFLTRLDRNLLSLSIRFLLECARIRISAVLVYRRVSFPGSRRRAMVDRSPARPRSVSVTMGKGFASTGDTAEKTISFDEIGKGLYAFTAEGDPNSGIIVGDDGVMVVDAQATPVMALEVIERVRKVTDKPIKYVLLSHYHAVRVLGASAYAGAEVIASDAARDMIVERGQQDMDSEIGRFPRLFRAVESIPGLTWPTITFPQQMSVWLGKREVRIMHLGRGHTAGDVVAYVPDANVVFSGDLVEYHSACYCGDAHLADWPATLDRLAALRANALVPGRGAALASPDKVQAGIDGTRDFLSTLYGSAKDSVAKGLTLKEAFAVARKVMDPKFSDFAIYEHCLPFNVSRAYDEARGIDWPVIWTAERDREMWTALQD